jgi:hypothetical protein
MVMKIGDVGDMWLSLPLLELESLFHSVATDRILRPIRL